MSLLKNINIKKVLISIIAYTIIIAVLSINEHVTDIIFLLAWFTIIIYTILSLTKVNTSKFKYFLRLNLIMLVITFLYDNYQYNNKNEFISNVILVIITLTVALMYYLKRQKNK